MSMKECWEYDGISKIPKDVKNVVVKDGIDFIPEQAFKNCTELVSIQLPDSIKQIGHSAFASCTSLISVEVPPLVDTIPYYTFFGCTSLVLVQFQIDNNKLTSIQGCAFQNCTSLTSIHFPPTLRNICYRSFSGCTSLTSWIVPPSIEYMEETCLDDCPSLTSIQLPYEQFVRYSINPTITKKYRFFQQGLFQFFIRLLRTCPDIAKKTCTDNHVLPLHLLLIIGCCCTECQDIVNAAPQALSKRDPIYHMYPFQLAACQKSSIINCRARSNFQKRNQLQQLECVYMLLREAPFVIHYLFPNLLHHDNET